MAGALLGQFGELRADRTPVLRDGAYAVILDEAWRVAVVVVGDEATLPGGGIEGDETPEEAALREVHEETGLTVAIQFSMGMAGFYNHGSQRTVNTIGRFFVARITGVGSAKEADHRLEWWAASRAVREMTNESHRFMLRRALGPC